MAALALGGCGVDCTRSLWHDRWVERKPPEQRHFWYHTKRGTEDVTKALITPAAAVVDVGTDKRVWAGVGIALVVVVVVVVLVGVGGASHGSGGGNNFGDCNLGDCHDSEGGGQSSSGNGGGMNVASGPGSTASSVGPVDERYQDPRLHISWVPPAGWWVTVDAQGAIARPGGEWPCMYVRVETREPGTDAAAFMAARRNALRPGSPSTYVAETPFTTERGVAGVLDTMNARQASTRLRYVVATVPAADGQRWFQIYGVETENGVEVEPAMVAAMASFREETAATATGAGTR
jgi:hypothetical protein